MATPDCACRLDTEVVRAYNSTTQQHIKACCLQAFVAELVDALDLGSSAIGVSVRV